MKHLFVLFCIFIFSSFISFGSNISENKNKNSPLDSIRISKIKNADKYIKIGYRYEKGNSIQKNYKKAEFYYLQSIKQNKHKFLGYICIACLYEKYLKKEELAYKYLEKAESEIENDSLNSFVLNYLQNELIDVALDISKSYYYGKHKNYKMSKEWCNKAAQRGSTKGQFALGYMFEKNENDTTEARIWYKRAANEQHVEAAYRGGMLALLQNDDKEGLELIQKAANQSYPTGMGVLAELYETGEHSLKQNIEKAVFWYEKNVATGDTSFKFRYQECLMNLALKEKSDAKYEKAIVDFKKLIELYPINAEAHNYCGLCYYKIKDYENALFYFQSAHLLDPSYKTYIENVESAITEIERKEKEIQEKEQRDLAYKELIKQANEAYNNKNYENAASCALGAIKYKRTAFALNMIGDCYYINGNYEIAQVYYNEALKEDNYNAHASDMAKDCKKQIRYQNAMAILQITSNALSQMATTMNQNFSPSASTYTNNTDEHNYQNSASSKNYNNIGVVHAYTDSYQKYESMLIDMDVNWDTKYDNGDRINYQTSMRQIREEWESKNGNPPIFKSKWEDWDGSK